MVLNNLRNTERIWDVSHIRTTWSVGSFSYLIDQFKSNDLTSFINAYYKSGEDRLQEISKLPENFQKYLLDYKLYITKPFVARSIPKNISYLNTRYGRTKEELKTKALDLKLLCEGKNLQLSSDECFDLVCYRLFNQTWDGLILREKNTIENLEKKYPNIRFKKTSHNIDEVYSIDFEMFDQSDKLVGALQIKPVSYMHAGNSIAKDKKLHEKGNKKYFKMFNVPIFYIFSEKNGNIVDMKKIF